jgi:integrase/recombinase XerD
MLCHNPFYGSTLRVTSSRLVPMSDHDLVPQFGQVLTPDHPLVPSLFHPTGERGWMRFVEFFTAWIRNRNTRAAYARAVRRFSDWCEGRKLTLTDLNPVLVAAYIEELGVVASRPTVKQHLAAIRMLFDWLVVGQVVPGNPTTSVRGPKHVVKVGKTPVLTPDEARHLLDSIDTSAVVGLRDRAVIATMIYTFARVGAAVAMDVADYYQQGKRWWVRLHEKGGKRHDVPAHHSLEEALDAYLIAAGTGDGKTTPLFRTVDRHRHLTRNRMDRRDVLAMVKRRAYAADLGTTVGCHSFRATGITTYLLNGGTLEKAQSIAAHESPRTTKLYDRTSDAVSLDEIERIVL